MDNGIALEVMETLRGCQTFFCPGFCAYRNQYGDECQNKLLGDALALIEQLIRQHERRPRVLDRWEVRAQNFGHGFIEFRKTEPDDKPEDLLFEIGWLGEDTIVRDYMGEASTGNMRKYGEYGKAWRIWDIRPMVKDREEEAWSE